MIIEYYETSDGKKPFVRWFSAIKDIRTKAKIIAKIRFLKSGNFSNCKPLDNGVFERKLFGIRLYFLKYKVLLCYCQAEKKTNSNSEI